MFRFVLFGLFCFKCKDEKIAHRKSITTTKLNMLRLCLKQTKHVDSSLFGFFRLICSNTSSDVCVYAWRSIDSLVYVCARAGVCVTLLLSLYLRLIVFIPYTIWLDGGTVHSTILHRWLCSCVCVFVCSFVRCYRHI